MTHALHGNLPSALAVAPAPVRGVAATSTIQVSRSLLMANKRYTEVPDGETASQNMDKISVALATLRAI
jgi:hypothetical protein